LHLPGGFSTPSPYEKDQKFFQVPHFGAGTFFGVGTVSLFPNVTYLQGLKFQNITPEEERKRITKRRNEAPSFPLPYAPVSRVLTWNVTFSHFHFPHPWPLPLPLEASFISSDLDVFI
jgi:hypothetical protein